MPESDQKKPVSTESSVDYIALLEQAKEAPEGAQQSAETFGGDVSEFGPDGGRRTLDTELAHQQANFMDASEVAGVEARQRAEAARKILDGIKVENAIIAARSAMVAIWEAGQIQLRMPTLTQ